MLTAYSFPPVNLSLAGTPKDFILFALRLWETCSWRDCAPETLRAAGPEPCFGYILPRGVLACLPTLLWVFSAQLAASLFCITALLAIAAQSPDETWCADHDNTLSCERRERCWKPAVNIPLFFFFPSRMQAYSALLEKRILVCVWMWKAPFTLHSGRGTQLWINLCHLTLKPGFSPLSVYLGLTG